MVKYDVIYCNELYVQKNENTCIVKMSNNTITWTIKINEYENLTFYDGSNVIMQIADGAPANSINVTTSGVVINAANINASAIFQIDSTTQGFLPPRMTTAQKNAISSPATGLVVYDTTLNKLCVYTGAAWETVTSA